MTPPRSPTSRLDGNSDLPASTDPARRSGLGAAEVIVLIGLAGFFLLWFLTALPRWRETARMAGCQKNMMQIGVALQLYHQANRHYPTPPSLGRAGGDSPVAALLNSLSLPDFIGLKDPTQSVKPSRAAVAGLRVPGLACPSDQAAMAGRFATALSYRADAGDTPDGRHGPFEPGRVLNGAAIEASHGLSYTSGFAERLVGTGLDGRLGLANYAASAGPVGSGGCIDPPATLRRGDAGSNWGEPGWRSALYNHVLTPGAAGSCLAEDGWTAAMGISSAHPNRVNVLLMDGSLRGVTPTIDPKVWRALGTVEAEASTGPPAVKGP